MRNRGGWPILAASQAARRSGAEADAPIPGHFAPFSGGGAILSKERARS
jgi:hypothetical protein